MTHRNEETKHRIERVHRNEETKHRIERDQVPTGQAMQWPLLRTFNIIKLCTACVVNKQLLPCESSRFHGGGDFGLGLER